MYLEADSSKSDSVQNVKYKPSKRPTYKAKDRQGDEFSNGKSKSPLSYKGPKAVKQEVIIDESGKFYRVDEKLGDNDYRPGTLMTMEQYRKVQQKQTIRNFYKQKAKEKEEKNPNSKRALVPRIYMNPNLDRIFGGNYIDVKLNGSVLLDFGYRIQTNENPQIPVNQRSIGGFFFDQTIQVNAQAKIGERLSIRINQDTKSQFDFDNNVKVEYSSLETDIIQKIEAGNVSMPINSSLITGAQNLFGIKAILKFGRLTTTTVLANQRGRQDEIKVQGGALARNFEIRADQYQDNQHYFLAQFFRDNYERSLGTMPQINSGVIVTRVEVWVTNRNNTTDQLRNMCAFMDLGENKPHNTRQIESNNRVPADNYSNTLWKTIADNATTLSRGTSLDTNNIILPELRRADNTANLLTSPPYMLENGNDFEIIRNARRLRDSEFRFHPQLGYVSLNAALTRDDVMGVAFEYSYRGQTYRVGELNDDYGKFGERATIFLKLLRPSTIRTNVPMWDLQMKNIYSLNATGITRENFQLRVTYRDDLTQLNNPVLKFNGTTEENGGIEGKPLLQVVGLDNLNMSNDPQPDGNFDYVESSSNAISPIQNTNPALNNMTGGNTGNNATNDPNNLNNTQNQITNPNNPNNVNQNSALSQNRIQAVTIDPQYGRVIFPVLEPFGKSMRKALGPDTLAKPEILQKYVYNELYSGTKADALQLSNKNKYFIVGRYQSSSSDEIQLAGLNIPQGSVKVLSGSVPLVEGRDFTVDYNLGKVKIINPAYLMPGQEVRVQFEKSDLFQVRQRGFFGTRWDYVINKDIAFGGTLLNLTERPLVTRVNVGDEPLNNTIWGFDGTFKRESGLITKLVDMLPVISTKEKSTIQLTGEMASLIPGTPSQVNKKDGANFFIDDFENTQIPFKLDQAPAINWKLASTPIGMEGVGFDINTNPLPVGYNRAKLAWYIVDPAFYRGPGGNVPEDITTEEMNNHYVRKVIPQDLFKNRNRQQIQLNEPTFDIAYFPEERGPYNFNPNLLPNGKLPNPKKNFGAMTRAVNNYDTDFDNANYQYIEFWLMDPFKADDRKAAFKNPNLKNTGGKIEFHLGNVSEDIIRDGRQEFEQGLPVPNTRPNASVEQTKWGYVTNQQYLTNAFSTQEGARNAQDIGLDGLDNDQEKSFYKGRYLDKLTGLTDSARIAIENDPAGDDFKHYFGTAQNEAKNKVIQRYKDFNGMEGNSPDNTGSSFNASSSGVPDNEDINQNNTLNDIEAYFKYEIDLEPGGLVVGKNYIINELTESPEELKGRTPAGNESVKWYLFRIPLREGFQKIGNIENFKSIRFLRTVLTDWEEPVVLRTTQFQLVASQWRPFTNDLSSKDLKQPLEPNDQVFSVSQVNIEENSQGGGFTSPYVLPPDFQRDRDLNSTVPRQQNEHSLRLAVDGLSDDDARAVFKNYSNLNLINYKRMKMFVHAEGDINRTKDGEVTVFMRLGSDFTDNYYEVEIPLTLTKNVPNANIINDPNLIWPKENAFDFLLEDLSDKKLQRDADPNVSKFMVYDAGYILDSDKLSRQKVYIRGNPVYTNIQTIMIGIRNPKTSDREPKSVVIWANEMRIAGFQNDVGWAATGRLNMKLADFGNVSATAKYTSAGFGGLEQKISQRLQENTTDMGANATLQMDKFIPANNKIGIKLPMFVSIDNKTITPKYDPTNSDVRLEKSVANKPDSVQSEYRRLIQDVTTKRSISFTNISKVKTKPGAKSYPFDIENLSATAAYSDINRSNVNLQAYESKNYRGGLGYNYSPKAASLEPFKSAGFLKSPYLKLVKDLNISLLPSNLSVRGELDRTITRTQYSNGIVDGKHDILGIQPTFEKRFLFNRNYAFGWNITKSLSFNYAASANAIIDEPGGAIDNSPAFYKTPLKDEFGNIVLDADGRPVLRNAYNLSKEDSILYNLKRGGRMKTFNQNIRVNYKIPLDKLPLTNWLSADAAYTAGYTWNAGALRISDTLGNTAQNTRDITLNARADISKLYSKSKFLAKVNQPPPLTPPKPPDPKDTTKKKEPPQFNGLKGILRFVMMLKSVNATYQQTEGTVLPGYLGKPKYFGLDDSRNSGNLEQSFIPFILGSQDQNIYKDTSFSHRYMSRASGLSNPINQNKTVNITGRANIEPFRDFKIQLDARVSSSNSYQETYRWNDSTSEFRSSNPMRTGNYSVSIISIQTHFIGDRADNTNPVFNQLENNRQTIRERLTEGNPASQQGLAYDTNNQDVLVPSFIAAYTGRDARKQALTPFPLIPLPNWRLDYAGLTNIFPSLKNIFPSINITHAYSSTYSVNSYISNSKYYQDAGLININKFRDQQFASKADSNNFLVPINVINAVTITERFAPFAGINFRTKSNISFRIEYRRDRTLTFNTGINRQLTELRNEDITIGIGYTKANMKLPFLYRGREIVLKNDVQFRTDFTYRDTETIQRRLEGQATVTQGTLTFQLRPNISYQINQRLNLQIYFQYNVNVPKVSTSFRNTTVAFGIQIRYSLS
jgi:cell surface protein SprA